MADQKTLTYLIKFVSDVTGSKQASEALRQLNSSAQGISVDLNKASKILDKTITETVDKQGKLVSTLSGTYRDATGKTVKFMQDMSTESEKFGNVFKKVVKDAPQISQLSAPWAKAANDFKRSGELISETKNKIFNAKTGTTTQVEIFKGAGETVRVLRDMTEGSANYGKVLTITGSQTVKHSQQIKDLGNAYQDTKKKIADLTKPLVNPAPIITSKIATPTGKLVDKELTTALNSQGQVVKTSIETYAQAGGKWVKVTRDMTESSKTFGQVLKTSTGSMDSVIANIKNLAFRAALTIPVWLALRQIMTSTLAVFSQSTDSIIDVDEALKNVANELQGTTENLPQVLENIRKEATALSDETGVAPAKIIESFRQFATAGFSAQDSLAGMNIAVKGAIATMGDSVELARSLSDIYNLMGDKITVVTTVQDKFNLIMSTMAVLMPKNVFTIKEFNDALGRFLPTAKNANLTLDETFAIVAVGSTLMQRGAREGTQLSSAFSQIAAKGQLIKDFLGKDFFKGDTKTKKSDFELFLSVVEKAVAISKTTQQLPEDIGKIFGFTRGDKLVKAQIANVELLLSQLKDLKNLTPEDRSQILIERFGTASEKIKLQLDRLAIAFQDVGKIIIEGVLGPTDSYADSLKKLTEFIHQKVIPTLVLLQEAMRGTHVAQGASLGAVAGAGLATAIGGPVLAPAGALVGAGAGAVSTAVIDTAGIAKARENVKKQIENFGKLQNLTQEASKDLSSKVLNRLRDARVSPEEKVKTVQQVGINSQDLLNAILSDTDGEDRKRLRELLSKAAEINQKKQEKLLKELSSTSSQKVTLNRRETLGISNEEGATIDKKVLDIQEDILRTQGATNSEIIKQLDLTRSRLGMLDTETDKVLRKLDLEREITKEQKLRARIGNDSLKLFDIAKTQGVDVAKRIGDVLQGKTDFSTFVRRGGPDLDIFKQQFADLFQNKQAESFFRGDRLEGFQDLTGGSRIPIDEEAIRRNFPNFDIQDLLRQRGADNQLASLKGTTTQNNTFTNTFNIQAFDPKKIADEVMDKVAIAIRTPGSAIQKGLAEALGGKDNTTL